MIGTKGTRFILVLYLLSQLALALLLPSKIEGMFDLEISNPDPRPLVLYRIAVVLAGNAFALAMWTGARRNAQKLLALTVLIGAAVLLFTPAYLSINMIASLGGEEEASSVAIAVAWEFTLPQLAALLCLSSYGWLSLEGRGLQPSCR